MDIIERSECVYYGAPIPRNPGLLTVLCLVFDKVHFPGAYLPMGGYDKTALQQEIDRLGTLPSDGSTQQLIGLLNFTKDYRLPLDGILEYPDDGDTVFGARDPETAKLAHRLHELHFPPRKNVIPSYTPSHLKGIPGSEESVVYAGPFFLEARAINYASEKGLPLLDDGMGIALPFAAPYKDNASSLATLLAIESAALVLPDMPVLRPQELVDFRVENEKELRNFRASMLRYARTLNSDISDGADTEEVLRKARFLADSEIAPTLHDLNRDLTNPNRPWLKRMADGVRITSSVVVGVLTGGLIGQTAAEGLKNAMLSEVEARDSKMEAAKRNGLYYLAKAKAIGK
ncbi:MAG: hypothetical protein AB1490_06745 [Pseudomonadota bacterium]